MSVSFRKFSFAPIYRYLRDKYTNIKCINVKVVKIEFV